MRDDEATLEELAKQDKKPITPEEAETMVKEIDALKYLECSALTRQGLKNVFDEALTSVVCANNKPKQGGAKKKKSGCTLL